MNGDKKVFLDRSKVDLLAIDDVVLEDVHQLAAMVIPALVEFKDPTIKSFSSILYDPADRALSTPASTSLTSSVAVFPLFPTPMPSLTQGRHVLRCIGYDGAGKPVAYADRSFYVWTSKPTGKPPDIAALEAKKTKLEAITKTGSGQLTTSPSRSRNLRT